MSFADPWSEALIWFGSAALAAAMGLAVVAFPGQMIPVLLAYTVLLDGPHIFGTWTRVYADPRERHLAGSLAWTSLLWFLPGFVALALDAGGVPYVFVAYLGLAALWGYYHLLRQNYGLLSILSRNTGVTPAEHRVDHVFLQLGTWLPYAAFVAGHPLNRAEIGLAPMSTPETYVVGALATAAVAAIVAYAAVLATRARRGRPLRAGLFLLGPVMLFMAFVFGLIGSMEPLFAEPANLEQGFVAVGIATGAAHALQYVPFVMTLEGRRHASGGSVWSAVASRPHRWYALLATASVAWGALSWWRGAIPGIAGLHGERIALALFWGIMLHHYWLDQHIWRPHRDPRLRAELAAA